MYNVTPSHLPMMVSRRNKILSPLIQFCQLNSYPLIYEHDITTVPSSAKKVVYLGIGDLIEEYSEWIDFNKICSDKQKIVFVITDNFHNYSDLSNVKFFALTEMNGVFLIDEPYDIPVEKTRLYNCFMNRVESVRQSWFYFLYNHNLLDRGYVSLIMNNLKSYSEYTGQQLFHYIHKTYGLDQLPHFEEAYQALKHQVPYQNFRETGNLRPYIDDSKYSLIVETSPSNKTKNNWHYSEKTFGALQRPTMPILFVQTNGIGLLKSLGFELYLDQSEIDHLPWQLRQQVLLKILIDDPFDFDPNRAIEICLHNRQILQNMLSLSMQKNYFDKIFDIINSY